MTSAAAPKCSGSSAVQSLVKTILILGASVCLGIFGAAPAMAQRGSHGGAASHGGGFGGSHGTGFGASSHGGSSGGGAHMGGGGVVRPAPRVAIAGGRSGSGSSAMMPSASGMTTGYAGAVSSGAGGAGFFNRSAGAPTSGMVPSGAGSGLHLIFVDDSGRVVTSPGNPPVGSRLWGAPPQQQQGRPVAPPPAPRPMPVAPMMRPPMGPTPIMQPPIARVPINPTPIAPHPGFGMPRPIPIPSPNPNTHPVMLPPTKGRPVILMGGANKSLLPVAPARGFVGTTGTPLPIPPQLRKIQLQPGIGGQTAMSSTGYAATPIPPRFCGETLGDCGVGFHRNFGFGEFGFGFGEPFFFAFGGPFGFGQPCLFNGFFLDCIGTGWNGPFGWGWETPWGYNPGSGSLYPIGGYYEPTPAEMNQESLNYLGPTAFLPPEPIQPTLVPTEEPVQPAAILVLKDGTEFGVTSYWLQDNRLYYVTTYNIQSSIPIDQLDLQATVDLNYKRGVTFTLTPKPGQQQLPESQPQQR
jgi:hypothetical protein